ncbi:MAG: Gfo/Idh/MocA family oxidoreductase [Lachnospiraceae bacterium]|nr:Gfo/Idh/MocA family oxidoreductase [Lachnospiraceae bacterium]
MIRYGIIGTGWITETFIAGAMGVSGMELAAVYSRSAEKGRSFAQPFKGAAHGNTIKIYTDLQEMAQQEEIDAVYIASPNKLHYEQSKLFLRHGKHVICEKPITIHPEQLEELQELAASKGLIYMEAIMMLHQPQLAALKEAVSQLGRIRTAHIDFSQLSSKYPAYLAGKNPNIFNPEFCTGALMDLGIYCIYLVLELFGKPKEIAAHGQFLESGADCSGDLLFLYEDCHVSISYSKVGQNYLGSQIIGDQGTLTIDSISQLTGMNLHQPDGRIVPVWGDEEKNTLMGAEARSFCEWILNPQQHKEAYAYCSRQAMKVCKLLETLRKQIGIEFKEV